MPLSLDAESAHFTSTIQTALHQDNRSLSLRMWTSRHRAVWTISEASECRSSARFDRGINIGCSIVHRGEFRCVAAMCADLTCTAMPGPPGPVSRSSSCSWSWQSSACSSACCYRPFSPRENPPGVLSALSSLRQIGVAMQSYHAVHNMFPSVSRLVNSGRFSINELSELTFLLPYLEQVPLYDTINMRLANLDTESGPVVENGTARRTIVGLFLCPSDTEPNHRNSYRFNRGRFRVQPWIPFDGPFSLYVLPSAASVTDGLSRTAFASERIGGSFENGAPDRGAI